MVEHEAVRAVALPAGHSRTAVAVSADVCAVVGGRLLLFSLDGHLVSRCIAVPGITHGIGRGGKDTVEIEAGCGLLAGGGGDGRTVADLQGRGSIVHPEAVARRPVELHGRSGVFAGCARGRCRLGAYGILCHGKSGHVLRAGLHGTVLLRRIVTGAARQEQQQCRNGKRLLIESYLLHCLQYALDSLSI